MQSHKGVHYSSIKAVELTLKQPRNEKKKKIKAPAVALSRSHCTTNIYCFLLWVRLYNRHCWHSCLTIGIGPAGLRSCQPIGLGALPKWKRLCSDW